jgi:hypothetical protein
MIVKQHVDPTTNCMIRVVLTASREIVKNVSIKVLWLWRLSFLLSKVYLNELYNNHSSQMVFDVVRKELGQDAHNRVGRALK